MSGYVFALLMRTDIRSLNPGKALAQATHAASYFSSTMEKLIYDKSNINKYNNKAVIEYELWKADTNQEYGTTLTFGVKQSILYQKINEARNEYGLFAEIINDPTYPDDGLVYPMNTCGFIFCPREHEILSNLRLHK